MIKRRFPRSAVAGLVCVALAVPIAAFAAGTPGQPGQVYACVDAQTGKLVRSIVADATERCADGEHLVIYLTTASGAPASSGPSPAPNAPVTTTSTLPGQPVVEDASVRPIARIDGPGQVTFDDSSTVVGPGGKGACFTLSGDRSVPTSGHTITQSKWTLLWTSLPSSLSSLSSPQLPNISYILDPTLKVNQTSGGPVLEQCVYAAEYVYELEVADSSGKLSDPVFWRVSVTKAAPTPNAPTLRTAPGAAVANRTVAPTVSATQRASRLGIATTTTKRPR